METFPVTKSTLSASHLVGLGVFLFYLGVQCDRFDTWSNIFLNEDHLKRFTGSLRRWMEYNGMGDGVNCAIML